MRSLLVVALAAFMVLVGARAAAVGTAGSEPVSGRLRAYVDARRYAERRDPALRRLLQSPASRLSAEDRAELQQGLAGGPMQVDEFVGWHAQVQADPALRDQVQKALAAAPPGGTSGAATVPSAPAGAGAPPPIGAASPQ